MIEYLMEPEAFTRFHSIGIGFVTGAVIGKMFFMLIDNILTTYELKKKN